MFYNNGTLFILSLSFFSTRQKGGPWWKLAHSICQVCGWFETAAAAPLCTPSRLPSPASVEGLLLVFFFFFFFLCYFLKASSPLFVVFICDVHQY